LTWVHQLLPPLLRLQQQQQQQRRQGHLLLRLRLLLVLLPRLSSASSSAVGGLLGFLTCKQKRNMNAVPAGTCRQRNKSVAAGATVWIAAIQLHPTHTGSMCLVQQHPAFLTALHTHSS
jgi:hypothetical protein